MTSSRSEAGSQSAWGPLLREWAEESPASASLIDHNANEFSRADVAVLFERFRETLVSRGIGGDRDPRPDVVCVALPEAPVSAVVMLAVADAAVCVPLSPNLAADEYRRIFRLLSPKAVVLQERLSARIRQVCQEERLEVVDLAPRHGTDAELSGAEVPAADRARDLLPEIDRGFILTTSGSTTTPKLVQLDQDTVLAAASATGKAYGLGPSDRRLSSMPLFHTQGLIGSMIASLVSRSSCTVIPYFDTDMVLEQLATTPVTWYSGSSMMLRLLVESAPADYVPNARLRFIRGGSGPVSETLIKQVEDLFKVPFVTSYGMTEAHQIASSPLPPRERRPGSVGVATGSSVAVERGGRIRLEPEVEGELLVKGTNLMQGYLASPDPERTFVDGWFRTGDLGRVDADGYIWISGRLKDVINRGGEKISPAEVEAALLSHPNVVDCAAFGAEDPVLGEEVCAAVVLRESGEGGAEVLRSHVRGLLTPSKVPRHVYVLELIPRSKEGKLRRDEVRAVCMSLNK